MLRVAIRLLAAGEDSRVLPVLVQHGDGVFEAFRPDVGEWSRFHERVSPPLRQMSVIGMSFGSTV